MKIKKIEIKNFRGIESLDVDLCDSQEDALELVAFIGANGCGKTSILEALLIALGHRDFLGTRANSKENLRVGSENYEISLTLGFGNQEEKLVFSSLDPLSNKKEIERICKRQLRDAKELQVEYFSSWREPKLIGSVQITVGKIRRKPDRNDNIRLGEIKKYLVNFLARKKMEEPKPRVLWGKDDEPLEKINKAWALFYPEKSGTFHVKPSGQAIESGFDLFYQNEREKTDISVDALSSGEIEVFSILGWFAVKSVDHGIIFIDEPELHLHPGWHRIILQSLRTVAPNSQIICATHSPQTLSCVMAEEVFILRKTKEKTQVLQPESVYGLDSNRILEDVMLVPERPDEIKRKLESVFLRIEKGELETARNEISELRIAIHDDPELVKAEAILKRKELIKR